ncbi:MAG: peptidylprolyl isomerase [Planctomycetes bacterium]|nr:peptidylprolyl isomerase [Planctomycetota bacterium]
MADKQHPLSGVTAVLETSAGPMTLEFFPDKAPGHVENFVKLAEKGFYDGTVFHRTIPGFMIQGGCPEGSGMGGPGYKIKAEFNDTPHTKGVLSMARSSDPNSAGSQFFICHGDARFLDRQYTAFGKLSAGAETLDKIATAPTIRGGENSKPVKPVKIEKVSIQRPGPQAKAQ